MASSTSPLLVQRDRTNQYRFRSTRRLCEFLGISWPYDACLAYAPYSRNPPHCSRKVKREKIPKVPHILQDLLDTSVPSVRVGRLLTKLSTHAVCGATITSGSNGWHLHKAPEVYQKWQEELWDEYLRVHGLDPDECNWVPDQLTKEAWETSLEEAKAEQEDVSEIDDSEEEFDSDLGHNDLGEDIPTPDTTISNFEEDLSSRRTQSEDSESEERNSRHPSPPTNPQPPSRRRFEVYRDPELQPSSETSGLPPVASRQVLRPLDRNIPISHPADRASPTWSHEIPEESRPSAPSHHANSSNTASHSEPEAGYTSSGDESSATPRDEVGSEDDDGNDDERQGPAGVDSSHSQEDLRTAENGDADSGEDGEDESNAIGSTDDRQSEPGRQTASDDVGDDGDLAEHLRTLCELFTDDDVAGTESSDSSSTDLTAIVPHHGFRLYPQVTALAQLKQLLHSMTQTVSPNRRHPGFIYAFARQSLPGFLKIGYTNDVIVPQRPYPHPVDNRLARWQADCGHPVVEVFRVYIPCAAAERIESLIHQTLREYRRVEDPPCGRCDRRRRRSGGRRLSGGGKHDEWFQVDEQTARQVVDLWRLFSKQLPYDRFGRLTEFWSDRVNFDRSQIGVDDSALSWTRNMPQMVQESVRTMLNGIIGPISMLSLR